MFQKYRESENIESRIANLTSQFGAFALKSNRLQLDLRFDLQFG